MTQADPNLALIERSSNFTLSLLSRDEAYADPHTSHRIHATVLRPLLARADACWAYGIDKESEAWRAAQDILTPEKGKFRVELRAAPGGDPVSGREYFWNASGGKRGTIVITLPLADFPADVFAACREVWSFDNYRAGHSPAAVKFAQASIAAGTHVAVCLPRNNGIQWAELFAPKPQVFALYAQARAAAHAS
jgi:hypothetical protein